MRKDLLGKDATLKAAVRRDMKRKRDALTKTEVDELSRQCLDGLLSKLELQAYDAVFLYAAQQNEVDAGRLLSRLLAGGKVVAYPKVTSREKREMEFFPVKGEGELKPGFQGILEPELTGAAPVLPERALLLVPGLAFSKGGDRIGYGGGYYDNYLAKHRDFSYLAVALAYGFQVVERLPICDDDVKMDAVATEGEIWGI